MSAFVVGGAFIGLQSLSYHGYVVVNHEKLKKDLEVRDGFTCSGGARKTFSRTC